ncbi:hypothetical protein Thpro_020495 [Acidihalobacter prosperus]|uniref:Uncharacterized protein n=1 Tax=Acidihalobacter prosperus TaxID=160660 RepID=A0A1A6C8A6_9GAMM|nr:hypothetical protein Thpro_020495 [Acidihalobacter prosperus]
MIRLRKTAIRILLLLVAFCAAPIALAWWDAHKPEGGA